MQAQNLMISMTYLMNQSTKGEILAMLPRQQKRKFELERNIQDALHAISFGLSKVTALDKELAKQREKELKQRVILFCVHMQMV
jgi:hypothetical protein